MTKLEQKLIELGYEYFNKSYAKNINDFYIFVDPYDEKFSKIHKMYVYDHIVFIKQQEQLDNLQQAFNVMQRDLEILKECEE